MYEDDPTKSKFLIKFKNKLDIGDANITILRNEKTKIKEIVIGFKTIFLNTFSTFVMDITTEQDHNLIFRHEGFQLWESECASLLLMKNKEYVLMNRDGIQVISLGSQDKRAIKDHTGTDRIIHSLEGYNYLKIDKKNYLYFQCQKYHDR